MNFGRYVVYGLIWVGLGLGVSVLGYWIEDPDAGFLHRSVAVVLQYGGSIVAGLCLWQLLRASRLQWKGIQMARRDPEGFAKLSAEYERAMNRVAESQPQPQTSEPSDTAFPEALPARMSALASIKSKVDSLSGIDYKFAHRMLVAAAEIVEKLLSFPGMRLQPARMRPEVFLEVYKLALSQLTFTFFSPDSAARISMAALVTNITDGNQVATSELWWEFERTLEVKGSNDDIRSLTAEIAAQRMLRALGGREDGASVAVLCFIAPWDSAYADLRPDFS
ncbi:MAG: hypothetical protein L0312_31035 [Acidobacteria bacterium]|nr:hypothetical protein [Acidobacteriota bacterium]